MAAAAKPARENAPTKPPVDSPAMAGYAVSFAFHAALFALLYFNARIEPLPAAPEPQPIYVSLEATPTPEPEPIIAEATATPTPEPTPEPEATPQPLAESTPEPTPPPPPPPMSFEAAATMARAEEAAEKPLESTPAAELSPMEFEPAAQTIGVPDGEITPKDIPEAPQEKPEEPPADPAEKKRLEEEAYLATLASAAPEEQSKEKAALKHGSDEIEERLRAAEVKLNAKKWLADTKGTAEGVVRSIDTSDVSSSVAQEVLGRYGIKITVAFVDSGGGGGGYGFLNQASTSSGTYVNRPGRGAAEVFSYGQAAIARMMQLEGDELKKRGLDPAKTRVVEIVYGIVRTTRGYDMGVRRIETAGVPPQ